ncbi:LRR domain containing protein [Trema orientale]|uniref:LRR domain containing protein n=1 Tax=Trema orientale TaxID=63057 RepID=A0A2P5EZG4_TREOI|nr:LRR domain containing protein [Trema orientale]
MPRLKRLEIAHLCVSTEGVLKIVSSCPELELLDIRGCQNVKLDENFVKRFSALKVLGLQTDCSCLHSRDFSDSLEYTDDRYAEYLDFLEELGDDYYTD